MAILPHSPLPPKKLTGGPFGVKWTQAKQKRKTFVATKPPNLVSYCDMSSLVTCVEVDVTGTALRVNSDLGPRERKQAQKRLLFLDDVMWSKSSWWAMVQTAIILDGHFNMLQEVYLQTLVLLHVIFSYPWICFSVSNERREKWYSDHECGCISSYLTSTYVKKLEKS